MLGLAQALMRTGDRAAAEAFYARAREILEKTVGPGDGAANYNQACVWALAGDRDRALQHLRRSSAAGYRNVLVARDRAFASLRGDPEFARSVAEITRRIEAERDELLRAL
jgi:Flp pilus assembly protein TadD